MTDTQIDRKGVKTYLGVCFGLPLAVLLVLRLVGVAPFEGQAPGGQLVFCLILWVPLLAALVASRVSPDHATPKPVLWPINKLHVLVAALVPAAVLAVTYTITTTLGWSIPDWEVKYLTDAVQSSGQQAMGAGPAIVLGFLLGMALGVTVCAGLVLGNELGWRNYLLARLLPMGRLEAYLLTSLAWAAWLAVIVMVAFRADQGDAESGLLENLLGIFTVLTVLGVILSAIWDKTRHTGFVAVCFGAYLGHALGIWPYLFPRPVLPWSSPFGLVAAGVLTVFAVGLISMFSEPAPDQEEPQEDGQDDLE